MDNLVGSKEGFRGFVIGGSPSVKYLDLSKLKNEIVVGANKAYKLCKLDYFVACDPYFWKEFGDEIWEYTPDLVKFAPTTVKQKLPTVHRFENEKSRVPTSFNKISISNNTGTTAIRIGYLLGLNPIYLIGFDFTKIEGSNNFHMDYIENNPKRASAVNNEKYDKYREETVKTIKELNIEIYSCSPYSTLNSTIPFVELESL